MYMRRVTRKKKDGITVAYLHHESWPNVRDECERLMLGHFSPKNGDLDQRTELTTKQTQFFVALGLEPPPKILGIHPRT
ncbi:hypothetical protein GsuE55_23030 [Geobacillus subterraneus]|uniref:Uncharacterized protein n=1 Tax=Geobacillus subterraneus TaxID=129338 RepID=A0A679FND1_9BACL|nr:hypothetical protein GsuE55_23030 [Geobacillus subterraneus]